MSLVSLERPADGPPEATLVLLHGRGADEHDLLGLFDLLDPARRLRGITVGGPLRDPDGGRHWYRIGAVGFPDPATFHATYDALAGFLDEELELDWSRTIVGGFSQGTVMSYALGLGEGRPVPAGILAYAGFLPTVEGWQPDLDARRGLPVLIAHGVQDPVIDVQFARDAAQRLRAAGLDVTAHEYAGGHTIDPRGLGDLHAWLGRWGGVAR
jgi:phospholipase/carboxylesterase